MVVVRAAHETQPFHDVAASPPCRSRFWRRPLSGSERPRRLEPRRAPRLRFGCWHPGSRERRSAGGKASPVTVDGAPFLAVPSEGGTDVFVFDTAGRQTSTYDAILGTVRYRFAWDPAGLASVTEPGERVTRSAGDGDDAIRHDVLRLRPDRSPTGRQPGVRAEGRIRARRHRAADRPQGRWRHRPGLHLSRSPSARRRARRQGRVHGALPLRPRHLHPDLRRPGREDAAAGGGRRCRYTATAGGRRRWLRRRAAGDRRPRSHDHRQGRGDAPVRVRRGHRHIPTPGCCISVPEITTRRPAAGRRRTRSAPVAATPTFTATSGTTR